MPEIQLIGVGRGKGTPAHEIKPGDRLMWNFGYISEVQDIAPCGLTMLAFTPRSEKGTT